MTKRLYTLVLPSGAQLTDEQSVRANLSELGQLDGTAAVEKLSQQPGGLSLRGQIRDQRYAVLMAAELRELGNSDDIDAVPLFSSDAETEGDGFYAIDRVRRIGPKSPPATEVQEFDLAVSRKGSRKTHWSAIATNPTDVAADNPFSSVTNNDIVVPGAARGPTRQWYDPVAGVSAPAHDPKTTAALDLADAEAYGVQAGRAATMAQDAAKVVYRNGDQKVNWVKDRNGTREARSDNLYARATDGDDAAWTTDNSQDVSSIDWVTFDIDVTDIEGNGQVGVGFFGVYETFSSTGRRWAAFDASGFDDKAPYAEAITSGSGDVAEYELYDVTLVSEDRRVPDPTLLYDLPHDEIGRADPTLWDDRGNANKVDSTYGSQSQSATQWQRVFATDHEFVGGAVVDNGRLRIYIDEVAETIQAERWDEANNQWSDVALGTSDWRPVDVDPISLGTASAELEVQFTDDGRYYALRFAIQRGALSAVVLRPPEETRSVPAGLQTLLDPIASPTDTLPQPTDELVARSEVRD